MKMKIVNSLHMGLEIFVKVRGNNKCLLWFVVVVMVVVVVVVTGIVSSALYGDYFLKKFSSNHASITGKLSFRQLISNLIFSNASCTMLLADSN